MKKFLILTLLGLVSCAPISEKHLKSLRRNYVPLPQGWHEVFVKDSDSPYKGEAFGKTKTIRYYISSSSPELYWVRLHERGHAWQFEKTGCMWHSHLKDIMSKRGSLSILDAYKESIKRGGCWFSESSQLIVPVEY